MAFFMGVTNHLVTGMILQVPTQGPRKYALKKTFLLGIMVVNEALFVGNVAFSKRDLLLRDTIFRFVPLWG